MEKNLNSLYMQLTLSEDFETEKHLKRLEGCDC